MLHLLHTTNDGRYILAYYKTNDGFLSDDSQNLLTQLLINHLFQDNSKCCHNFSVICLINAYICIHILYY